MKRWLRGIAATAALAAMMGSMVVTTSSAAAEPGGCAAKDFLGKDDVLRPGRALCNGNYLLRMQENGDLVLREISTGRACWHSNTFVKGVSATFEPGRFEPLLNIKPVLKVGDHRIVGDNDHSGLVSHDGTSANLTSKGELYIGYLKKASC